MEQSGTYRIYIVKYHPLDTMRSLLGRSAIVVAPTGTKKVQIVEHSPLIFNDIFACKKTNILSINLLRLFKIEKQFQ